MPRPQFSFVVPSFQRREPLIELLDSIDQAVHETNQDDFEVVVVLDGSTDGSADALSNASYGVEVRTQWQANAGRSAARNAGLELARGTICWLLDDDMTIDHEALKTHMTFHAEQTRPAALVGPQWESESAHHYFVDRVERLLANDVLTTPFDFWTGNFSIALDTLKDIGGFNESFKGWGEEDIELGFRLFQADIPIHIDAAAGAKHWRQHTASDQIGLERERGRNLVRLCEAHEDAIGRLFPSSAVISALHRRNLRSASMYGAIAGSAERLLSVDRIRSSRHAERIDGIGRSAARVAGVLDLGGSERVQRTVVANHHSFSSPNLTVETSADQSEPPLRSEYREAGFVEQCFPLHNPAAIQDAVAEASQFVSAVDKLRDAGHRRVPYFFTPATKAIARDPAISSVVEEILGDDRWVSWGSNMQVGTPNDAGAWHRDVESFHWPTITVVVGLDGCRDENATSFIPGSWRLGPGPEASGDPSDTHLVVGAARYADHNCTEVSRFQGFGDAMFGVFNARSWHRGDVVTSNERLALFLHYQHADDPRIPYMRDYEENLWFDRAVDFIVSPAAEHDYERALYPLPGPTEPMPPRSRATRKARAVASRLLSATTG